MSNLRSGKYGNYYGSYWGESKVLTVSQMQVNAWYIHKSLTAAGWTTEAIAGMLGNLQHESSINPGRWQSDNVGNTPAGYSLTQWTPSTNYTNWCTQQGRSDPSEMDNAIDRIIYELNNNLQYYKTPTYPETFKEFSQSQKSPYYLACAFAWNYERSAVVLYGTEAEKEALRQLRGGSANDWYSYLTGNEPPDIPDDPDSPMPAMPIRRGKYKFLLFGNMTRRNRRWQN